MIAERISLLLQSHIPQTLIGEEFRPAAVLVPIQERGDGEHLVLTQRSEGLPLHRGQVAFPGGGVEPSDQGELEAALRESQEEIGIDPGDVRILGRLDQVLAGSNYLITPFVGVIPFPYEFRLDPSETAAVFSVPVSALLDPACFTMEHHPYYSSRWNPVYHFRYDGWHIWGATARIVKQFLELVYGFQVREDPNP